MIRTFKSRALKRFFDRDDRSGINPALVAKINRLLDVLHASTTVQGMNIQGWRLHPLKGEFKGFWSVTVSGNWRIIFRFENGDAYDVTLIDYH